MLSGGNRTDGNTLEKFLNPYQYSRLPLTFDFLFHTVYSDEHDGHGGGGDEPDGGRSRKLSDEDSALEESEEESGEETKMPPGQDPLATVRSQ